MKNLCIRDSRFHLIEGIPVTKLFVLELNNLVQMMFALENDKQFPILTQTIILPTLLNKTTITYHQLLKRAFYG